MNQKSIGAWTVRAGKYLVIGMIAVLALSGDLSRSAYAWHHKHRLPKTQKMHYKPDKNAYLFGGNYKTPKKQHLPKGTYHTTLTGETIYGKH